MKAIRWVMIASLWGAGLTILPSCTMERPPEVPANAVVATSGQDRLTYSVPRDGTIWVYEVSGNHILYSGSVNRNQSVVVDTMADNITVDGKIVLDKGVDHGPTYRVFFQATDQD